MMTEPRLEPTTFRIRADDLTDWANDAAESSVHQTGSYTNGSYTIVYSNDTSKA